MRRREEENTPAHHVHPSTLFLTHTLYVHVQLCVSESTNMRPSSVLTPKSPTLKPAHLVSVFI